ncbi:hypothetical protein I4U23_006708 [Adineta vaga]|nr:hypothetical protein I4U23_006708 [Adineta vaga]
MSVLTERISYESTWALAKAIDFNKLVQDNEFLSKLKNLSITDQLKIFDEYKEKFFALNANSQSSIAQWIGNLSQHLPNTDIVKQNLDNGIEQGQKLFENIRNSLK